MSRVVLVAAVVTGVLTGCSSADQNPVAPTTSGSPTGATASAAPSPTPSATTAPTTAEPTISEPTTTNTLPPPPQPSKPAPSTAGSLSAGSLPVPAGWKTVARPGGAEEGYEGNGTWVHAKDPRYAAQDLITIGCAPVTRDDYPDPTAALEGSYVRKSAPGVGLVLQFADDAKATAFFARYVAQVRACTDPDVVQATVVPSSAGLIDRRTYPDGDWTEVAARRGSRATFVVLNDGGATSTKAAEAILAQIR